MLGSLGLTENKGIRLRTAAKKATMPINYLENKIGSCRYRFEL